MNLATINDVPRYCREYLSYVRTIRNLSEKTVWEYYLDLRTFFRYLMLEYKLCSNSHIDFNQINASDVPLSLVENLTLANLYEYLNFRIDTRANSATTRMRKISSLKGFYKFLFSQKMISRNPALELESPKKNKRLPIYLNFEQSLSLLASIDGRFQQRNLAIITLFLNCGLRLSELVGLNFSSIQGDVITVIGKGDKERQLYLNEVCKNALNLYEEERKNYKFQIKDKNALFLSQRGTRISPRMVQDIVKHFLQKSGLDPSRYSVHKLRHTAATLMHQNGVDIRVLQEILGHINLGTTQIYTHVSDSQLKTALKDNPLNTVSLNEINIKK